MGLSKKTKKVLIGLGALSSVVLYGIWKSLDLFNLVKDDPFDIDFSEDIDDE